MDELILKFFESIRSPLLDVVFSVFTFLGEGLLLGGLIVLLYWLFGKRAEQLFFTSVTSFSVNGALKAGILRPRPYAAGVVTRVEIENPLVSTMDLGDNLSFPSGHLQSTSAALFSESLRSKKVWPWVVSVLVLFLIACSRVYLGVHYPSDVLAGFLIGLALAIFWHLIFRYAYRYRYFVLMGVALALLFALPFAYCDDGLQAAGMVAGGAFFLPLADLLRHTPKPGVKKGILRVLVGGACSVAVLALTLLFPEGAGWKLLKWFLVTGAAIFLSVAAFKALKL